MLNPILIIGASKRYVPLFSALKDLGIETEQVPSPSEALSTLCAKSYGAVLMECDQGLPSGIDTAERSTRLDRTSPWSLWGAVQILVMRRI